MNDGRNVILDELNAGILSMQDFREQVIDQVYSGLHQYCQIPDGYQHCDLSTRQMDIESMDDDELRLLLRHPPPEIVNPHSSHIKAIKLFELLLSGDPMVCEQGDPLSPTIGAYLYGPPGCGKTHLMAAYGRRLKQQLDERLADVREMMGSVIDKAYVQYLQRRASEETEREPLGQLKLEDDNIFIQSSPEDEFWHSMETFKRRLSEYDYQPTDLIYIGFKELFEVCKYSHERHAALRALESARVVFIDDIHPQDDPEQIQLVLHLLERRYELGRSGTFLTTNLQTRELGGGDDMLGSRLLSRCAETLLTIDFTGCDDWRQTVKARRIKLVEEEVERRMEGHLHLRDDPDEIDAD
ncbi:MAG TPA: hypothetical protein VJ998_07085 [Pseudomonadales bacterium]|nr:hypothetical protein [Pseudomonadales bacterium]